MAGRGCGGIGDGKSWSMDPVAPGGVLACGSNWATVIRLNLYTGRCPPVLLQRWGVCVGTQRWDVCVGTTVRHCYNDVAIDARTFALRS
jgi:hypothetical protein